MRGIISQRVTGLILAVFLLTVAPVVYTGPGGNVAKASDRLGEGVAEWVKDAAPWGTVTKGLALFDTQVSLNKNLLGDGWEATLNSVWNNRRYNFGLADLTLNGVVVTDLNFTRRLLLAGDFSSQTIQTPLAYTFNINDGIQDLTATGNMTINNSGSINALGFYDLRINISNRGTFSTEGYGLVDSGTTDFDIGPINVTGNIFVDMIAAVAEPFFAATGQPNVFAKISGRAAKPAIGTALEEALRSKVAAGQLLTQDEIESLIGATITASLLGDTAAGLAAADAMLGGTNSADLAAVEQVLMLPEPATALLLSLASLALFRRPGRR